MAVTVADKSIKVDCNIDKAFFVGRDLKWLRDAVGAEAWTGVQERYQVVFVANGVREEYDREFAESGAKARGRIFSLCQLCDKLDSLQRLIDDPTLWNSGKLLKIAGCFKPKKFKKLIEVVGWFIDRGQFFYSVLDPINESEYDCDLVVFKLSNEQEAECLSIAKKKLEDQGRKVCFANFPESFNHFRERDLNVEIMKSVFDSEEFKSNLAEHTKTHPNLAGRKVSVPTTIVLTKADLSPEVDSLLLDCQREDFQSRIGRFSAHQRQRRKCARVRFSARHRSCV